MERVVFPSAENIEMLKQEMSAKPGDCALYENLYKSVRILSSVGGAFALTLRARNEITSIHRGLGKCDKRHFG